jgi:hypothetical protein
VRLVRLLGPPCGRSHIDEDTPVLYFHRICGDGILLEAWLALAGTAVEFPVVPGADDVVAVEPAVTKRSADVIAGVGHDAELAILVRERQVAVACRDLPQGDSGQFRCGADIGPILTRHGVPRMRCSTPGILHMAPDPVNIRALLAFPQDRRAPRTPTGAAGPNTGRGIDLAIVECMTICVSRRRWWRLRPQFRDQLQNLLEHLSWMATSAIWKAM